MPTKNCWICEGWSSIKFRFQPPEKVEEDEVEVKLHLDIDDYKGELLENVASQRAPK